MATFEHLRNDTYVITPIDKPDIVVGPGEVFDVGDEHLADSLRAQPDVYREIGDGTQRAAVPDVLDDVGDDPDKARAALALEEQSDKPRKTLVTRLNEIIDAASDGGKG